MRDLKHSDGQDAKLDPNRVAESLSLKCSERSSHRQTYAGPLVFSVSLWLRPELGPLGRESSHSHWLFPVPPSQPSGLLLEQCSYYRGLISGCPL